MTRKLVIFGLGDLAQLAGYLFPLHTEYEIAAYCVDAQYAEGIASQDSPVITTDRLLDEYPPAEHDVFVAIGYRNLNKAREEKYRQIKDMGYRLASYISPMASVFGNVVIGENCFIFENNVVQPFVTIGNNTVLWSGNHVGHHTKIGDNCFIASHAVISGRVEIGNNVFIGVNATLRDQIKVGSHCVIGAGTLLLKDAEKDQVFVQETTPPSRVPSYRLRGI
jgi:sugar O-acyltransferase (sialic acid O-acetyltransferase NeuD family)